MAGMVAPSGKGIVPMAAKYILVVLAAAFLVAAALRLARDGGRLQAQSRTWFVIAIIFGAVGVYLFTRG